MAPTARTEMNVSDHQMDSSEDPTMTEVKARMGGYQVNADLVAQEIIRKLRLVKMARLELANAAGHTPGRSVRDR
jgi:hypothetical protein